MNRSQIDLKAYFLGELGEPDRRAAEEHAKSCRFCREELERLRITRAALAVLPEEEIPRRIAFVSDKVFEPGGWARFWNSAPRLGFASAALLAAAILVHAFVRPAPVISPTSVDRAALEARIEAEVATRLKPVVEKALADAAARQSQATSQFVAAAQSRFEQERKADMLAVEERFNYFLKKIGVMTLASSQYGGAK
jgi:DNA-binding LytR/AlgR family response regulator